MSFVIRKGVSTGRLTTPPEVGKKFILFCFRTKRYDIMLQFWKLGGRLITADHVKNKNKLNTFINII